MGISVSINRLIDGMSRIKRIHTFFDNINKPVKVTSFTLGKELGNQIEEIYHLEEKYS